MTTNRKLLPLLLLALPVSPALPCPVASPVSVAEPAGTGDPAPDKDKPVSDDFLYDTIRRKLASDQIVKGGALDLDVKAGVVTLKGTVDTERQKEKAEKVVKKVSGVKSVVNQIKLANP